MTVVSAGAAINIPNAILDTVLSGGETTIDAGAIAIGTAVGNGSEQSIDSGATLATVVGSGGTESVLNGLVSAGIVTNGGSELLAGSNTVAGLLIESGGTVGLTLASAVAWSSAGTNLVGGVTIDNGGLFDLALGAGASISGLVASAGDALSDVTASNAVGTLVKTGGSVGLALSSAGGAWSVNGTNQLDGVTIDSGADTQLSVAAGGSISGFVAHTGDELSVLAGGSATNAVISAGGLFELAAGGDASGTIVDSAGFVAIGLSSALTWNSASANLISGVTIDAGAGTELSVASGGSVTGLVASAGAFDTIAAGGSITGATIRSGATVFVEGGSAAATVLSGGSELAIAGGSVSGSVVSAGGAIDVGLTSALTWSAAATNVVDGATVQNGAIASLIVDAGGSVSGFVVGAGAALEIIGGAATSAIVSNGGDAIVLEGTASGTVIESGGSLEIDLTSALSWNAAGANLVAGVTIDNGAHATLLVEGGSLSGFVASNGSEDDIVAGAAISTMVGHLGTETVEGGTTTGTTVGNGGVVDVAIGTATSTTVTSGGELTVASTGSAAAATIGTGGELIVSGGTASNTTVSSGGAAFIGSGSKVGGTVIDNGGLVELHLASALTWSAGAANVVNGLTIGNGATTRLEIDGGGSVTGFVVGSGGAAFVFAGASADAAVVESGGVAFVGSGGTASGTTVSSGGVEQIAEGGITSATALESGGTIDLMGVTAISAVGGANVLSVTLSGGGTLDLSISGSLQGDSFAIAADHSGGTDITLGSSLPVLTPVLAAPASATLVQDAATAISGVSLSESNASGGETFTVTLTDGAGDLSASGASGNGTTSLIVSGSFSAVNSALATLKDTDGTTPPDSITLNAVDNFGNHASTQQIAVTVSAGSVLTPVITAPTTATLDVGKVTKIAGISLAEATAGKTETFTVTLADSTGDLKATGKGVTGAGASLTISGVLTQVNADLKTSTDTDATTPGDTITINAVDQFGNDAVTKPIMVTVKPPVPVFTALPAVVVGDNQPGAVSHVSLSQADSFNGELLTVTLHDKAGHLSASGAAGNGTTSLTITGSLSTVNGALATLQETETSTTADSITLNAVDQLGDKATAKAIAVHVNGLPTITVPASEKLITGGVTKITGISVKETGTTTGETFTVTLQDATGDFSSTAAGVTGSGTNSLTVSGSLAAVTAALAKVTDTDSAADTITVTAADSFGSQAVTKEVTLAALTHAAAIGAASVLDQGMRFLNEATVVKPNDGISTLAHLTHTTIGRELTGVGGLKPIAGTDPASSGGWQDIGVPHALPMAAGLHGIAKPPITGEPVHAVILPQ